VPVHVLDLDPELGEGLDLVSFESARRAAVAADLVLSSGSWNPPHEPADRSSDLGLLVTDGLLFREATLSGTASGELIGRGDVLRPWDDDGESGPVPLGSSWHVLEPARLAVLDRRFTTAVASWPQVTAALAERLGRRASRLACLLAISHLTRTDARVLALLWHLADRYGRVTARGVVVPLDLTHEMVGRLVGARRQSVTTALGELGRRGLVMRLADRSWLLHGDPAAELAAICAGEGTGPPRLEAVPA
jgi:CRP/FNR family transcriptional regulator, cyclic AMP receptor protein